MLRWRLDRPDPAGLLEQALSAIAAREDVVRAFVTRAEEGALRAQADAAAHRHRQGRPLSPIDGMPVGIKDIVETADLPTQMGSPLFAGWQAGRDAAAVRALRRAGALVMGKTVTTEFAVGASGPTTNPHDPRRTPGGSSSGSAAGVAAGFFCAALGTQTMGSVVRPAAYCGIWGYKPSHGLLSLQGVHPLSATLDDLGVLASGAAECWAVARALSESCATPGSLGLPGDEWRPPAPVLPRRLLFLRGPGWHEPGMDAAAQDAFLDLAARLRSAGVAVTDAEAAPGSGEEAAFAAELAALADDSRDILAWEMQWPLAGYAERGADAVGPRIRELLGHAATLDRAAYGALLQRRARMRARFQALMAGFDAVVCPAASGPAPEGLDFTGSRSCQAPWSWLGMPALSLPLLQVQGLPLGLQLVGAAGSDAALFAAAGGIRAALEA